MIVRVAILAALAAVVPVGAGAQAAVLEEIRGIVLVDQGSGYAAVTGMTVLAPGNSVIVNPGSSAQIAYDDGCKVPIQPGAVVAVSKDSPCSQDSVLSEGSGSGQNTGTTLLVAGGVVGLGVGALILLTADGDDGPASP